MSNARPPSNRTPSPLPSLSSAPPSSRYQALARWTERDDYPWWRLAITLMLMTIGNAGMWVVPVVLPAVQADFGIARAAASLPYTTTMIGFGIGGVWMGRLADRHGVMFPALLGTALLAIGFGAASLSPNIMIFAILQGILIGVGSSALFAPLVADTSLWFTRHRGIAVGICACGNYLAGVLWPPLTQAIVDGKLGWLNSLVNSGLGEISGWRLAYLFLSLTMACVVLPMALLLAPRPPALTPPTSAAATPGTAQSSAAPPQGTDQPLGLNPSTLMTLLCVAGVACCVAMSMPQVHLVAYCGDLGFGPTAGAQMLSLMLAAGVISRLSFGFISDRIGGLRTLWLGSLLQGLALLLYLPFEQLWALYVVSALFGLFQGGIVPSYAIIVRELFPPQQAGARVGMVITATLFGMALGGWMSGLVFDLTGSYHAAFINGIVWNLLNLAIASWLVLRSRRLHRLS